MLHQNTNARLCNTSKTSFSSYLKIIINLKLFEINTILSHTHIEEYKKLRSKQVSISWKVSSISRETSDKGNM